MNEQCYQQNVYKSYVFNIFALGGFGIKKKKTFNVCYATKPNQTKSTNMKSTTFSEDVCVGGTCVVAVDSL